MNMFGGLTGVSQLPVYRPEIADPTNPISPHDSLSRWTEMKELARQINQDMRDYYDHPRDPQS